MISDFSPSHSLSFSQSQSENSSAMDREQEKVKSLGFFGTVKESFKLVAAWKKVFFQITLALILPLSLFYLTYQQITSIIFIRIVGETIRLDEMDAGTSLHDRVSRSLSSEWLWFWLIKIVYFTFLLVFSLLSTAAVTYTVASVYAHRDITFRKVMSVVPKVWKRLAITFLCTCVVFFLYNTAFIVLVTFWFFVLSNTFANIPFLILICIVFSLGFVYLNVVWQLTSVISVLENYKGFKAMKKSRELMKGKFWMGLLVLLFPGVAILGIEIGFIFALAGWDLIGLAGLICVGILLMVSSVLVILYYLVIQTVLYFVCKSYHNEDVDGPTLAIHLGDYDLLIGPSDIQMGDVRV